MKDYKNPQRELWPVLCQRPKLADSELDPLVASIFENIKATGDEALIAYAREFDGLEGDIVKVPVALLRKRAAEVSDGLRLAIDNAYANIKKFHMSQARPGVRQKITTISGVSCWQEFRPIDAVGLYVPGGTAPLISTVLMLGVPAQIAGCIKKILCTPAKNPQMVNPAICYAALKVGIEEIYCVGGAQAIAAMAVGTQTIPKLNKLFGPGNQYVTAAKGYASKFGVAIDMQAGPSEVMVLVDDSANPAFVAADLLSQAEHGADSQVMLVSVSVQLLAAVKAELAKQLVALPRRDIAEAALQNSRAVLFDDVATALAFANEYAPEHIIMSVRGARDLCADIQNAGSVFLGNYSPESAGDYASGTNHTLPTGGWAKSSGGVSVDSFMKRIYFQEITKEGIANLDKTIGSLAAAEGLEAHARASTIRLLEK